MEPLLAERAQRCGQGAIHVSLIRDDRVPQGVIAIACVTPGHRPGEHREPGQSGSADREEQAISAHDARNASRMPGNVRPDLQTGRVIRKP
jgi:hypothetical protein